MIRGTDVKFTKEEGEAMVARLRQVVESNYLMWGEQQEEFQKTMAKMAGRKYAMTYSHVTQATEAIFSILKPKIVAFQGNQFPSVIFAAQRQGAQIMWVDIDLEAMQPSVNELDKRKMDVLVLQHTGGFVGDGIMNIRSWCSLNDVFLLEDASQAMGTMKAGDMAGHWGDVSVISLSGTKYLTTGGQGGIVLFDEEKWWEPLFQRKVYGRTEMFQRGEWVAKGWNSQMTEIQAAVGNALIPFLGNWVKHRSEIADVYEELFDDTSLRPCGDRTGQPNWYKYPVMLPTGVNRDEFKKFLEAHGVQCASEVYPLPIYAIKSFGGEFAAVNLPNTEKFSRRHICLPMHNAMTAADAKTVVSVVNKFFREA